MTFRKKLITWIVVVPMAFMSVTVTGCGFNSFYYYALGALGYLYYHLGRGSMENHDSRLDASYAGTLELRDAVVTLNVTKDLSQAAFVEDAGLTVVGMHDQDRDITIEIGMPGDAAGTWTKAENSDLYFRVKVGEDEYMAADGLTVKLDAPAKPGQQLRGTVEGSVSDPSGSLHDVKVTFDATRS